ncbi:MAG: hypothetical protein WCQ53_03050 [bacterium]
MTSALSAKLNRIFKMKQEIRALEEELHPLIDEVKAVALKQARNEQGYWVLENGLTRAFVFPTMKVEEAAIGYMEEIQRNDLISVKPYVTRDALSQIMGESEMVQRGLVFLNYSLRVVPKGKE